MTGHRSLAHYSDDSILDGDSVVRTEEIQLRMTVWQKCWEESDRLPSTFHNIAERCPILTWQLDCRVVRRIVARLLAAEHGRRIVSVRDRGVDTMPR